MTPSLTAKQLRALRACGSPNDVESRLFWFDARASWQGPRRTLGSLHDRGLVSYTHEAGWDITDAGRAVLAQVGSAVSWTEQSVDWLNDNARRVTFADGVTVTVRRELRGAWWQGSTGGRPAKTIRDAAIIERRHVEGSS